MTSSAGGSSRPIPAARLFGIAVLGLTLATFGCDDSRPRADLAPESGFLPLPGTADASGVEGPIITLVSNIAGTWMTGVPSDPREIFMGQGLRFEWSAVPGANGAPIVGFSFAVDDSSDWSPFSLALVEWPPQPVGEEVFWFPEAGVHKFFLRASDEDGFVNVVVAEIVVFPGPQFCPPEERFILVVLDTDPGALVADRTLPPDYADHERSRVEDWFAGWNYQVFETGGTTPPAVSLMSCASSIFWFHSADVAAGDESVLETYHATLLNHLAAYRQAGGNVFLGGVRPSQAMRYLAPENGDPPVRQDYPLDLENPPASFQPHWLGLAGVGRIERTVGNPAHSPAQFAIKRATSTVGGANPYPDLPADPAIIPPSAPGFGYFDRGIVPAAGGDAEVIYEANDTGIGIGVRWLTQPGVLANLVYLGFHPWFVDAAAFGDFVAAVLDDFGEVAGG